MKLRRLPIGVTGLTAMLLSASVLGWSPYGYGPPPGYGPGYGPSAWGYDAPFPTGSLRVTRDTDAANYYVIIHLDGVAAADINVALEGRLLAISRKASAESSYEYTSPDRAGYAQSYSYSSGGSVRRLGLPRDADTAAMTREDGSDRITITFPRRR